MKYKYIQTLGGGGLVVVVVVGGALKYFNLTHNKLTLYPT